MPDRGETRARLDAQRESPARSAGEGRRPGRHVSTPIDRDGPGAPPGPTAGAIRLVRTSPGARRMKRDAMARGFDRTKGQTITPHDEWSREVVRRAGGVPSQSTLYERVDTSNTGVMPRRSRCALSAERYSEGAGRRRSAMRS